MQTILLDIGGVLTPDPWESICLTPECGLASLLGVPADVMLNAGNGLWAQFAVRTRDESEYWAAFSQAIGIPISLDLVARAARSSLIAAPAASSIIAAAQQRAPGRVGIISDNTSFFFPQQDVLLGLGDLINPDLIFLSHVEGLRKRQPGHGLFEHAARHVDPSTTLIVDDRVPNIERAKSAGFHVQLADSAYFESMMRNLMPF